MSEQPSSPITDAVALFPASAPRPDLEAIERLAALDALEYDRVRKAEAERLGVRVTALDDQVRRARQQISKTFATGGGRPLALPDTQPWDDAVDGAAVLDELSAIFQRHLSLPAGAAAALALWCAFTYAFDVFPISPRLAITSPERRCGKTTLLTLLGMLCHRVVMASNISTAAVFRSIELARPTLLIDEADTFLE